MLSFAKPQYSPSSKVVYGLMKQEPICEKSIRTRFSWICKIYLEARHNVQDGAFGASHDTATHANSALHHARAAAVLISIATHSVSLTGSISRDGPEPVRKACAT